MVIKPRISYKKEWVWEKNLRKKGKKLKKLCSIISKVENNIKLKNIPIKTAWFLQ